MKRESIFRAVCLSVCFCVVLLFLPACRQTKPDIHHTEAVPSQFADYRAQDWQQLWQREIHGRPDDPRVALKTFFRDCANCDWTRDALTCGHLLLTTGKAAFYGFAPIPVHFTWDEDRFRDHTWQIQYNALTALGWLAETYDETHQPAYLDRAKTLALSWIRNNHREQAHLSPLAWHDHVEALRLMVLTYLWELLREAHYPLQANEIRDYVLSIHDQMDLMHQPHFYNKHHNHGYYQSRAVLLASAFFPFCDAAPSWRKQAVNGMEDYMDYAVTDEGFHKEHSSDYHFGMIRIEEEAFRLFQQLHIPEDETLRGIRHRLTLMRQVSPHWITATGELVPNGDTPYHSPGVSSFPTTPPTSVVYPHSGYASFRNAWTNRDSMVHLFFTNAYFSNVHKHADNLGFHLTAFNHTWLTDAGYKDYNRDAFHQYDRSVFAHNVIVIDEKSPHLIKKPAPNLVNTQSLSGKGWIGVLGTHRLYPGFEVKRTVWYNRDKKFLIRDRVDAGDTSQQPHRFDVLFQVPPEVRLSRGANPVTFIGSIPGCPWRMALTLKQTSGNTFKRIDIVSGQTKPYLLGWYFPSFGVAKPLQTIRFRFEGHDLPQVTWAITFFKP